MSNLDNISALVFLDLEFTCWEDSIATDWADPGRPPEVLEIGAIGVDMISLEVISKFTKVIQPEINPVISEYCRSLTGIDQSEVDHASSLSGSVETISVWLNSLADTVQATCTWGPDQFDRGIFKADCDRNSVPDPFTLLGNMDLQAAASSGGEFTEGPEVRRESMWALFNLDCMIDRHRALADAEDVLRIYRRMVSDDKSPIFNG